jgi:hypothetical protein
MAQHNVSYRPEQPMTSSLEEGFNWSLDSHGPVWDGVARLQLGPESITEPLHPIYVVPFGAVQRARAWSVQKTGF